jgi:hypothetical protein
VTDLERLDAVTDAAIQVINELMPFANVRAEQSDRQLDAITTQGSLPNHDCMAQPAGVRLGKECVTSVMKTVGSKVEGLQLPVGNGEDLLVETWKTGRRSIFVTPEGEMALPPNWQTSNADILKRLIGQKVVNAATGDLIGHVYDLEGIVVAYGNYGTLPGCHIKEGNNVVLAIKPNFNTYSLEAPLIIGVRIEVHVLAGSAHRIVRA